MRRLFPRFLMTLLAAAALLPATACLRSRVHITSEPSGAEVIWRGQPYGATPVTIPFIWYWHYDFSLEKPGYERVDVVERFRTPPWFLMPIDLFMEMLPVPIPDNRYRHYMLQAKPLGERLDMELDAPTTGTQTLTLPGAAQPR